MNVTGRTDRPATWGWAAYDRLVVRLKRLEAKEDRKKGKVLTKRVSIAIAASNARIWTALE